MTARLESVTFDVEDADAVASFWAGLLDREVVAEPGGALVPGDETQVGLRFVTSDSVQVGKPRLHLHVTSTSLEHQLAIVDTVLRLGGAHLDVGQGPDVPWIVLADPGGNELCVIEPDNRYLAGTGLLGEVTCDGGREVGVFWRDALGWPLVLDEDGQTAVQSPLGGTKIAWDGWDDPATAPTSERSRQRFDLVAADLASEADRLVALGATRLAVVPDGLELADPGGGAFGLREG